MDNSILTETSVRNLGPPCGQGAKNTILFGWALEAPTLELPKQVGFKIGGDSGINYLVLQVHYGDTSLFRNDTTMRDESGIQLSTVSGANHGITKLAGIYLLFSTGNVNIGKSTHIILCSMQEDKKIHPFKFRTHTHKLGVEVGAYKEPLNESNNLVQIGKRDPQQPQMFYSVDDPTLTLSRGDKIHAYCKFNNNRGRSINIGPTNNDEMCNFYVMYWTEGTELLNEQECHQYNS